MKAKGAFQLLVFLAILAAYYIVAWPLLTKEALAAGVAGGILLHYLTNKGNKSMWNMHPLGGGFRVLFYDVMLAALLAALAWTGQLSLLLQLGQVSGLAVAIAAAILLDYSVRG